MQLLSMPINLTKESNISLQARELSSCSDFFSYSTCTRIKFIETYAAKRKIQNCSRFNFVTNQCIVVVVVVTLEVL